MREIKFRGKRLDNGVWVEGSLLQDDYGVCMIVEFVDHHEQWHEVDPDTVGQYTGMKDKNGKEIWEGDIFGDDDYGTVRSVFRVPGGLAFEDNPLSFGYDHRAPLYPYSSIAEMQNASWLSQCCEIIGNIHDHKHLLK